MSTDLRGRIRVEPYWSTMTSGVTVAEEDMQGVHAYFWEAPQQARFCRAIIDLSRIKPSLDLIFIL